MRISAQQARDYRDAGFVFIPGLFSPDEVVLLKHRVSPFLAEPSPRRILECDGRTVRSIYGLHLADPAFQDLIRDVRLLAPAAEILGEDFYVHQLKVNMKQGFSGDIWEWHQDFIFWLKEDGLQQPRLTTAVVFLDEVNEFNAPLCFIPHSHKVDMIEVLGRVEIPAAYANKEAWISNLTAKLRYSIPNEIVTDLIAEHGLIAPKGAPGSVLFFHPNTVHGSAANISPFGRMLVLVTYNTVSNAPVLSCDSRPDFLCARDFSALTPMFTS
jgi:ectoine hydroxylase